MREETRIDSALTGEQWGQLPTLQRIYLDGEVHGQVGVAGTIAVANSLLAADDPRKITRAMVSDIRGAAVLAEIQPGQEALARVLTRWADALSIYLPPDDE